MHSEVTYIFLFLSNLKQKTNKNNLCLHLHTHKLLLLLIYLYFTEKIKKSIDKPITPEGRRREKESFLFFRLDHKKKGKLINNKD